LSHGIALGMVGGGKVIWSIHYLPKFDLLFSPRYRAGLGLNLHCASPALLYRVQIRAHNVVVVGRPLQNCEKLSFSSFPSSLLHRVLRKMVDSLQFREIPFQKVHFIFVEGGRI
jgi:hypothetical protein